MKNAPQNWKQMSQNFFAPWTWAGLKFERTFGPSHAGQQLQVHTHPSIIVSFKKFRRISVTGTHLSSIAAMSIRCPAVWATPHRIAAFPPECHWQRGCGHDVWRRFGRDDDAVRHKLLGDGGHAGPVGAAGHAAPAAQGWTAAPGGMSVQQPHDILAQQPEAGVRWAALKHSPT